MLCSPQLNDLRSFTWHCSHAWVSVMTRWVFNFPWYINSRICVSTTGVCVCVRGNMWESSNRLFLCVLKRCLSVDEDNASRVWIQVVKWSIREIVPFFKHHLGQIITYVCARPINTGPCRHWHATGWRGRIGDGAVGITVYVTFSLILMSHWDEAWRQEGTCHLRIG